MEGQTDKWKDIHTDRITESKPGELTDRQMEGYADRWKNNTDRLTYSRTDIQLEGHTDKLKDIRTDIQLEGHTDRLINRQTGGWKIFDNFPSTISWINKSSLGLTIYWQIDV